MPPAAAAQPRVEGGTHNVGAQGAEGCCAAGEQVAAVERQKDLDVVLTVSLWGRRECQAHICRQGALQRPPPQTPGPGLGAGPLLGTREVTERGQ